MSNPLEKKGRELVGGKLAENWQIRFTFPSSLRAIKLEGLEQGQKSRRVELDRAQGDDCASLPKLAMDT